MQNDGLQKAMANRKARRTQKAKDHAQRKFLSRIRLDETLLGSGDLTLKEVYPVDMSATCDLEGCTAPWSFVTHATVRGDRKKARKVVARRCWAHRTNAQMAAGVVTMPSTL